jgi:hypothetical protein
MYANMQKFQHFYAEGGHWYYHESNAGSTVSKTYNKSDPFPKTLTSMYQSKWVNVRDSSDYKLFAITDPDNGAQKVPYDSASDAPPAAQAATGAHRPVPAAASGGGRPSAAGSKRANVERRKPRVVKGAGDETEIPQQLNVVEYKHVNMSDTRKEMDQCRSNIRQLRFDLRKNSEDGGSSRTSMIEKLSRYEIRLKDLIRELLTTSSVFRLNSKGVNGVVYKDTFVNSLSNADGTWVFTRNEEIFKLIGVDIEYLTSDEEANIFRKWEDDTGNVIELLIHPWKGINVPLVDPPRQTASEYLPFQPRRLVSRVGAAWQGDGGVDLRAVMASLEEIKRALNDTQVLKDVLTR